MKEIWNILNAIIISGSNKLEYVNYFHDKGTENYHMN